MEAALKRAIENLEIHDVYLRSASIVLAEDFEPKYDSDAESLLVQFKHRVRRSEVMELEDENGSMQLLFRVYIDLGARWVDAEEGASMPAAPSADAAPERARIDGTMVAEYLMREFLDDESQRLFAHSNASYHVWPYWREYLSAQCLRTNLPKITLPAVRTAVNLGDTG
ncbi:MAG: preprotein translocase subunit SecB [Gammaproteobacteria bacterium]|nr:preprotein translocase subunit SecB [Gammaproteobacteria bacterium]